MAIANMPAFEGTFIVVDESTKSIVPAANRWSAVFRPGANDRRVQRSIVFRAKRSSLVAHAGAPSRLCRGMPDPVPVVLLARLALDRSEQRKALGGHLLVDALRRCVRGAGSSARERRSFRGSTIRRPRSTATSTFHQLDDRRLWRRLADVARALGE